MQTLPVAWWWDVPHYLANYVCERSPTITTQPGIQTTGSVAWPLGASHRLSALLRVIPCSVYGCECVQVPVDISQRGNCMCAF